MVSAGQFNAVTGVTPAPGMSNDDGTLKMTQSGVFDVFMGYLNNLVEKGASVYHSATVWNSATNDVATGPSSTGSTSATSGPSLDVSNSSPAVKASVDASPAVKASSPVASSPAASSDNGSVSTQTTLVRSPSPAVETASSVISSVKGTTPKQVLESINTAVENISSPASTVKATSPVSESASPISSPLSERVESIVSPFYSPHMVEVEMNVWGDASTSASLIDTVQSVLSPLHSPELAEMADWADGVESVEAPVSDLNIPALVTPLKSISPLPDIDQSLTISTPSSPLLENVSTPSPPALPTGYQSPSASSVVEGISTAEATSNVFIDHAHLDSIFSSDGLINERYQVENAGIRRVGKSMVTEYDYLVGKLVEKGIGTKITCSDGVYVINDANPGTDTREVLMKFGKESSISVAKLPGRAISGVIFPGDTPEEAYEEELQEFLARTNEQFS